uniref:Uncharacterized protein n=1 Tax=Tectiviridae sp. cthzn51 TaxID=2826821 RepID=A0A8S5LUE0_9VIRU|nr:MAG TPA: hypothetical protein [Tectiviridae sp. cthzn51]
MQLYYNMKSSQCGKIWKRCGNSGNKKNLKK